MNLEKQISEINFIKAVTFVTKQQSKFVATHHCHLHAISFLGYLR